jgi:hypothetical protein
MYVTTNAHGQWSLRVEPSGLQIDAYHHADGRPHMHRPGRYETTTDLPGLTAPQARRIVRAHLEREGEIRFRSLLKELRTK